MKIEIDQSGKIEKTNKDTILAFSNDIDCAILIPARIKRQLKEGLRKQGRIQLFIYRTFATGIVLLIKDYLNKIDTIVIDQEYTKKDRLIKNIILEMLGKMGYKKPHIYFKQIGKKSKAHFIAYGVAIRKRKADKIVKLKEFTDLGVIKPK